MRNTKPPRARNAGEMVMAAMRTRVEPMRSKESEMRLREVSMSPTISRKPAASDAAIFPRRRETLTDGSRAAVRTAGWRCMRRERVVAAGNTGVGATDDSGVVAAGVPGAGTATEGRRRERRRLRRLEGGRTEGDHR